jgi:hypothetical protein
MDATIVKPEDALAIKAFGLDLKVLLTTEATGGVTRVTFDGTRATAMNGTNGTKWSLQTLCSTRRMGKGPPRTNIDARTAGPPAAHETGVG